ncbi:MazG nucleotide pyrophosphohydrolase domain-containing protein [Fructilactobacillus frigidiflavus]|uniref:MazG nucleotide pyrophosphohydrolase domain-containing protein n=1 Tax=Fructilactobacillus frigidiflavus TaxID=3242688 RepID=UPI0037580619
MEKSLKAHQKWLVNFYKDRDWYNYSTLIRLNFLSEEVGELNRAVRSIELGRDHPGEANKTETELQYNLREELADCLDQILIIADKYDIDPQVLIKQSEAKIKARFNLSE